MLTNRLICLIESPHAGPALLLRWTLTAIVLSGTLLSSLAAASAPEAILPVPPASDAVPSAPAPSGDRILGVIPNYQTVNDSSVPVAPLTPRQKWSLALRETMDPFNVTNAIVGSGFSQMGNQTPKYGEGAPAFAKRFG